MSKKKRGYNFGAKIDPKKNGDGWQKKAWAKKSQWGAKRAKRTERSLATPRPSYEVQEIKISDIKVQNRRRALNPDKLKELVEDISIFGLKTPITVRPVKRRRDWADTEREYLLTTGWHRLEAMEQLGETTIPSIKMDGDEHDARIWEISENLHRAELTPLEYDEQVAEWMRLTKADTISGQNVQEKGRGRPKGGMSEAARKLPVKGKTQAAKRRTLERALKVDSILPEAKDAAKKAGLDKIHGKLLEVAAEKTLDAQLAKVRELTARKSKMGKKQSSLSAKQKTQLSAEDAKSSNASSRLGTPIVN